MVRETNIDPYPESDRRGDLAHPREATELFGHEAAEQEILNAIGAGRMHHAWLITGPKGIGKATLAYRIARYLFKYGNSAASGAVAPPSLEVIKTDPIFQRVASLGHTDLTIVRRPYDPKTRSFRTVIPVDEIRRATRLFGKKAGEGGWRICIIDSADELNANAANALLKVLEEPPPKSLFLLISHAPGRLLPTIRSRCRSLALRPLEPGPLSQAIALNAPEIETDQISAAARLSGGSAGRALTLHAEGGLALYEEMTGLLMSLPRVDMLAVHALAGKLGGRNSEQAYDIFSELLGDWFARLVRVGAGRPDRAEVVVGEAAAIARLAAGRPLDQWVEVWDKVGGLLDRAVRSNLDKKQVILSIFSTLENSTRSAIA